MHGMYDNYQKYDECMCNCESTTAIFFVNVENLWFCFAFSVSIRAKDIILTLGIIPTVLAHVTLCER